MSNPAVDHCYPTFLCIPKRNVDSGSRKLHDFLCQEGLSCPDGRDTWQRKAFPTLRKGEKQLKETREVKLVQKDMTRRS
ncbi:hypothetical protein CEXT_798201 [Caerostris extrusa]|uniref:Uncharacterized protein n=1 Tax=Caerostris extrusa TaxID=172846 RepID=A0AAV4REM6_CAEEX|nr:hypothetical protein CEXT_798201 [Caerostris extrusa]